MSVDTVREILVEYLCHFEVMKRLVLLQQYIIATSIFLQQTIIRK